MDFYRQTSQTLQDIAITLNHQIIGIINYFSKYNSWKVEKLFRHLDYRLVKWIKNKYKSVKSSYTKASKWLESIKSSYPHMFSHWQLNSSDRIGISRAVWRETFKHGSVRGLGWNSFCLLDRQLLATILKKILPKYQYFSICTYICTLKRTRQTILC